MAQVIRPEDFNSNTRDPNRGRWTWRQMDALVTALDGAKVVVELETQTGHAWEVTLERVSAGYHLGGSVLAFDGFNRTWQPLYKLGVVMDVRPGGSVKWDAVRLYREREQARKLARA
jgi:hypothetical protein